MNQQENREDDIQTKSLADLELTSEQADKTKAGAGGGEDIPADLRQKYWHPSDFVFVIDGLEKP